MKKLYSLLFVLFFGLGILTARDIDSSKNLLSITSSIPNIPVKNGLSGSFIGISHNVLIVAGGVSIKGGLRTYSDSIFVCKKNEGDYNWKYAGKLPFPSAYGSAVSTENGLLCIGGEGTDEIYNTVILLKWNETKDSVVISSNLPDLPQPTSYLSASVIENVVYVIGGKVIVNGREMVSSTFWKLDLTNQNNKLWLRLPTCPGEPRLGASLIKQSNGEYDCLYLLGGKSEKGFTLTNYSFNPKKDVKIGQWKEIASMPFRSAYTPAVAVGGSQIFMFGSGLGATGNDTNIERPSISNQILSYNTITDVWYKAGQLLQAPINTTALTWDNNIVIPGGESIKGISTSNIIVASFNSSNERSFSYIDHIILVSYLVFIVLLGYHFSKRNRSSKDFFLGGQKIPFWAAGLSMMAAQVSSIGFMAIPAKSFATDWSYFSGILTWFIVIPVVIYGFVPFYRRLNVTSAFEYLEKRFNPLIRKFIAALFLLFQLMGRLAAIIFLPSLALSAVTGIDTVICILIIGFLSTVYTVMGGMYAVIWIDVIQALIMFGSIFLIIGYILLNLDGGGTEFAQVAWNDHKFSLGSFDFSFTKAVFWVIIIGNIFSRMGTMSSDQSVVQRYLTTKDEKETVKALWTDVAVSIPWAIAVFGLGTALYVFYKANPGLLSPLLSNDEIVPFFIGQNLPSGTGGIVIAGIFAASMSSVDSSIHSSTTVLMRDFFHRQIDSKSELKKVSLARWITAGLGLIGTSIAVIMAFFDITSIWDIVLELEGLFVGSVTGIFLLGIFSDRANGKGAVIGILASGAILMVVKSFTPLHFFLYSGIGIISCVLFGYLSSLLFSSVKSTQGLTIYSVKKNKE
jgi:SSS family transporter